MQLDLKPSHKPVRAYYESLAKFDQLGIKYESAVRSAFHELLETCTRQFAWKLVPEYALKRKNAKPLKADGALLDVYGLTHGIWEAKDTDDDLDKEIKAKFDAGYPRENILFQEPRRAVLYQQGQRVYEADLTKPDDLVHTLQLFLEFAPPAIAEWLKAVEQFKDKVPELGTNLQKLIRIERQTNAKFIKAFGEFHDLCRASLNPNISANAVEEMIIQHLLTERLFRKIFSVADFMQRNVIAQEIEKVIAALTSKAFSRDDFLKSLDHFYKAIEAAAATITDFSKKQTFLNTIYERFFQGFSVRVADTHGIVYTPQPLVDFMVTSVEHVLHTEFNRSLSHNDVHLLDPFTGTGNFIVNIMRRIKKSALPHKYDHELHCNEVMLLPYYVASMNIEHAQYEATGSYKPFEGICLVDTFETAEKHQQLALFSKQNAARVERQKKAPIKVVIANPPYNAGQVNENDNNKNRKYPTMDERVAATYGTDSTATLQRKLWDPFVKAIRFAADRIGEAGIVCYVNNNSFITEKTFDGMRKHLEEDFDSIYVLDLGGNVRKNPKLSGTTHNVFGIQVGVSINLFVRQQNAKGEKRKAKIYFHSVGSDWRREQKYDFLESTESIAGVKWRTLKPDARHNWLTSETDAEFAQFFPVGSKEAKSGLPFDTVFRTYSLGVSTNRDAVVYDFDREKLAERVEQFTNDYNAELHRWRSRKKKEGQSLDSFLATEKVKWSETLKRYLAKGCEAEFDKDRITTSSYRPFTKLHLYYAPIYVDRPGAFDEFLPDEEAQGKNLILLVPSTGGRSPFWCFMTNLPPNLDFVSIDRAQAFPLFTYAKGGGFRRENVTPNAIAHFRKHYANDTIQGRDIFNYCYAVLHHPAYRERYAENLKRDLPRIPFLAVGVVSPPLDSNGPNGDKRTAKEIQADNQAFGAFAKAGQRLAALHVNYENHTEYPLKRIESREAKLDWRVDTMKMSKDRTSLRYNDFLTLSGIPKTVFDFRLGNRSALEWVIDQYRVSKDEHGNIVSDPNRLDDEQYIVRLIGQVITVSLETMKIVNNLPELKSP